MRIKQKKYFIEHKLERKLIRFLLFFYPFAIFMMAFLVLASPMTFAEEDSNSAALEERDILVKLRDKQKVYALSPFAGMSGEELIKSFTNNPWVEYAEVDASYQASRIPNDPEYSRLWYLPQINAPSAWDVTTGSEDVIVAVLDTGVDLDHPDLKENIWNNFLEIPGNGLDDDKNGYIDDVRGWNFVDGTNDPSPQFGIGANATGINHGTLVSGIIGAVGDNSTLGTGVAWKVRIMPLRVLDSKGTGNASTVEYAIDYAVRNGAKILNLSFVGTERSITLDRAIERAYNAGVLVVVAAGNNSTNGTNGIDMDANPVYPACSDGPAGENWVLAVAALDTLDQKLAFSNYGNCVDLVAPGLGIFNTTYHDLNSADYQTPFGGPWRGTSMAAPQVAGAAALVAAFDVSFSNKEIRDLLLSNSIPVDAVNPNFRGKLGAGKPDIAAALRAGNTTRTKEGVRVSVPSSEPKYIVAPLSGVAPEVRVLARDGEVERSFMAYAPSFRGGVSIAVGDLDGDGFNEIVTGAGPGGGPHIRIFSNDGSPMSSFFAFETAYRGGVRVATADINGDGIDEIVVASGRGREAEIRIFNREGTLITRFFAFGRKFRNPFSVASGDTDGNGNDEIIVSAGPGGGPHVQVFTGDGELRNEFFAYERSFTGGVEVTTLDFDGDKKYEIAAAPAGGRARNIKIFSGSGAVIFEFQAYLNRQTVGLRLAAFDFDNDEKEEIITTQGVGGEPILRVFTPQGLIFSEIMAFSKDMKSGVNAAVLKR